MTDAHTFNPTLMLPVGTQVVTRVEVHNRAGELLCPRGSLGVIVDAPADNSHAYRVRFPDGFEASFHRPELTVRKHYQQEGLQEHVLNDFALMEFVFYRCIVGSRAYGLDSESSDTDRRGIYLPPADMQWSLYGLPEQLENKATDEVYWELQKFLNIALKANPNVLECLYSPLVETVTPLAQELLAMREMFLSRMVYQTYNGYVLSQFKKLEQDIRNHGEVRGKHAMHLIRLLLSGITVLKEGFVPVRVGDERERLLAIKSGAMAWDEVNAWRLALHKEFDAAFTACRLPDRPDYDAANRFLLRARRSMV